MENITFSYTLKDREVFHLKKKKRKQMTKSRKLL